MTGVIAWLAAHRKAALAVLGTGATLIVTLGLDNRYPWLAVVVAVATAAGVYQVRNVPVPPPEKTLAGRPPLGPGAHVPGGNVRIRRPGDEGAPGAASMSRRFELHRDYDESGVSGVGMVAEGVSFADGTAALRWTSAYRSTAVYASMADLEKIHGHNGATRVVWVDHDEAAYRKVADDPQHPTWPQP